MAPSPAPTPTLRESQSGELDARGSQPVLPRRSQERYVFLAEHARGGLGRVWRVFDRELGRELALKESLADDAAARTRFTHEALTTAQLEHPAIVPVHDAGESTQTGALFYTMKLVSGSTLADVVAKSADLSSRLALLPRVLAVAEAVGYAHSKGVLHRDLKPENILVGTFGETVVIDWGLAKALASEDQRPAIVDSSLTRAGAVMGTPGYMSPEQAAGREVDARTDVYALGAVLASLVTGTAPAPQATGPGAEWTAELHRSAARDLLAIIRKAMAPAPADRYPDAKALAEDLNRYLTRQPVEAHRYSLAERAGRWVQRHRALAVATAVGLALTVVAAAVATVRESVLRRQAEISARSLLELQGRSELAAGHPRRAAVYFAEALRHAPDDAAVRMLLSQSVRALAARRFALTASRPIGAQGGAEPDEQSPARIPVRLGSTAATKEMTRDVVSVDWSPNGRWLATGGDDEAVRVWDAQTGALLKAVATHAKGIDAVSFSADSALLASAGADRKVRVVRLDTLEEIAAFDDPNPYRVIFSPDASKLIVGDQSGEVRVLDARTGARLHTLVKHTNRAQALAFSPAGDLVVVAWDRSASLWSGATFELLRTFDGFDSEGASAAFSHDGKWAALAESDDSIHIYRLPSWEADHRIRTPEDSRFPIINFSLDDQQLFARGADGVLRVWHLASGALLATVDVQPEGKLFDSAVSPDGRSLLTAGLSGSAVVWSLDGVFDYRVLPWPDASRPVVLPGAVTDRGRLVLPDSSGKVTVLHPDGAVENRFEVGEWPGSVAVSEVAGTVLVSNERRAYHDLKLRGLDGRELAAVPHPRMVMNVAVSRDGSRFATACYDGAARIIDARTGAVLLTAPVSQERLSAVAFSPDGAELAVADGSGQLAFVAAATGAVKRRFAAHATWIDDVEYAPEGKRLVTAGRQDHRVRVWALESLAMLLDLADHTNNVTRATFSPDGSKLATVGIDHQALLYDASTGKLLRSWRGPAHTAEFIADGTELLTTGYGGYVVSWNIAPDHRSSAELIDFVGKYAPWQLRDGRLVLRDR